MVETLSQHKNHETTDQFCDTIHFIPLHFIPSLSNDGISSLDVILIIFSIKIQQDKMLALHFSPKMNFTHCVSYLRVSRTLECSLVYNLDILIRQRNCIIQTKHLKKSNLIKLIITFKRLTIFNKAIQRRELYSRIDFLLLLIVAFYRSCVLVALHSIIALFDIFRKIGSSTLYLPF